MRGSRMCARLPFRSGAAQFPLLLQLAHSREVERPCTQRQRLLRHTESAILMLPAIHMIRYDTINVKTTGHRPTTGIYNAFYPAMCTECNVNINININIVITNYASGLFSCPNCDE